MLWAPPPRRRRSRNPERRSRKGLERSRNVVDTVPGVVDTVPTRLCRVPRAVGYTRHPSCGPLLLRLRLRLRLRLLLRPRSTAPVIGPSWNICEGPCLYIYIISEHTVTFILLRGESCVPTLEYEQPVHSLNGSQVKSSLYINNRQPYGSLSNVLRKPAGEDGSRWRWRRGIHLEATRHKC